ncbi:biopolymer transporter ExbD [Pontibacter sp. FD36]|jgi:biopolymer transport protein ExbD|uniref:Outer membrane transport energization protein ExbD n=1 Tax=Pontibacter lucknowensis TaxID=1077936 RepID=A0A1N6WNR0_9BACT|nr:MULTISPECIES: biopolymer transporter ExbD [Pontibacter]EJF09939.1 outer membrane transport energization protein exbd [Pontibacter sp. BAB1700]MBF8962241.1 biopolymer transporter ExbD [Pontibacter sp. FD36]SIQ91668.1 outer membrane transport energization protein ExbD [Pontibacter lucknowensis]
MNLRSKNRINPDFNMSSMTDIIFLLLIFFMLTSNFVTPTGLPVSLPSSKVSNIVMEKVNITITKDIQYFLNGKQIDESQLESQLAALLQGTEEGVVVLNVDKTVPVEYLAKVAGIAASLKAKVTLATEPTK